MRLFKGFAALSVIAGLMLAAPVGVWGQEKKDEKKPEPKPAPKPAEIKSKDEKPAQPPGGTSEDDMAKMMAAGEPGPHHDHLKVFVGSWKCTLKMFMGPEPSVSEGTATFEPIHGGRFIKETFKGDFGGMPFEGFGLMGYDNVSKKHVGFWCDNMGTGFATSEGTCDASAKVFTATLTCNDPATGKMKKSKELTKFTDDNTFTFTMTHVGEDGKEMPEMEIIYKRQ